MVESVKITAQVIRDIYDDYNVHLKEHRLFDVLHNDNEEYNLQKLLKWCGVNKVLNEQYLKKERELSKTLLNEAYKVCLEFQAVAADAKNYTELGKKLDSVYHKYKGKHQEKAEEELFMNIILMQSTALLVDMDERESEACLVQS